MFSTRITRIKRSSEVKWKFRDFVGNLSKFDGLAKEFLNFALTALIEVVTFELYVALVSNITAKIQFVRRKFLNVICCLAL